MGWTKGSRRLFLCGIFPQERFFHGKFQNFLALGVFFCSFQKVFAKESSQLQSKGFCVREWPFLCRMVFSLNIFMGNFRIFLVIRGISCNFQIFFCDQKISFAIQGILRRKVAFSMQNGLQIRLQLQFFHGSCELLGDLLQFSDSFCEQKHSQLQSKRFGRKKDFSTQTPQNKRPWGVWLFKLTLRGVSATFSTVTSRQKT